MLIAFATIVFSSLRPLASSPALLVRSVERSSSFAGKLGDRIELRLEVEISGHTDWIQVGRQHTKFGQTLQVDSGDRVMIDDFVDKPNQLVMPSQIHNAN